MATREGSWGHRAAPLLGQFKGTPMLGRLWEKRGCRPQSWVNLRVPRCWASFGVLGVQRCPKIGGGESLGVTAGQRRCPKLQDKDGVLETCGCWVNPGGQGGGLGLGWGPGVGVGVGCFLGWGALTGALAGRFGAVDGAGVELIEPRLQEGHGHGGRQPGQALPQRRALPAGTRGHSAGTRPHNHRPTPGSPRGGGGVPRPPSSPLHVGVPRGAQRVNAAQDAVTRDLDVVHCGRAQTPRRPHSVPTAPKCPFFVPSSAPTAPECPVPKECPPVPKASLPVLGTPSVSRSPKRSQGSSSVPTFPLSPCPKSPCPHSPHYPNDPIVHPQVPMSP